MIKDRLDELKQFLNENGENKSTVVNVNNANKNTQLDTQSDNTKLVLTLEKAKILKKCIEQMENNNEDLRIYIRRIDDMEFNQKDNANNLQSCFQNNTSLAQDITHKLNKLYGDLERFPGLSTAEERIRYTQLTTLNTRFQNALSENTKLLENYKTIQKQIIQSELVATGYVQATDENVALLLEEGSNFQIFTENISAESEEDKAILVDVEERHQQLIQIERMLQQLWDIYLQMAFLIGIQGEVVDLIERQPPQRELEHLPFRPCPRRRPLRRLRWRIIIWIAIYVLIAIILNVIIILMKW